MMNMYSYKKIRGVSLIDALIAMAVGGIGLLALAVFQADMTATSSESRTRAEAVHLAQQRMEQLRNVAAETDLYNKTLASVYAEGDLLVDKTETGVPGVNATYTVTTDITGNEPGTAAASTDARYLTAKVTVGWTNSENIAESVFVSSFIAWDDPVAAAARGPINDITDLITVGAVAAPSGGGRMANDTEALFTGTGIDNGDGTFIYADGNGNYQIAAVAILGDGSLSPVFVSSEPLLKISGNISTNESVAQLAILRVLTSDFGFCLYREGDATFSGSNGLEYVGDTTDLPLTGDFNCYIAASWHGNVGVLNKSGEDFCSASHRYLHNCDILGSPLYEDATGGGSCPYSGNPVNGLIGELLGQNFSINNGGCEVADLTAGQPAVVGSVGINTNAKTVEFSVSTDAGVTYNGFVECSTTLQGNGPNAKVNSYKCVTQENALVKVRVTFGDGSTCITTPPVSVATLEVVRDINNTQCN